MRPMHELRTLDAVRWISTPSVSCRRVSGLPVKLFLGPAAAVPLLTPLAEAGVGAGDDVAPDDGEPSFVLCFFSASTNFFHLTTRSEAARAISLLGLARSLPTKTPALVA